ncbi:MAG: hypothetical protein U9O87_09790 [Verrucomicrobiota bacterium]|nr:hypothetical protein [Verrucomicrobiota bacterium]
MKILYPCIIILFLCTSLSAQISMQIKPAKEKYLLYEEVKLSVSIRNYSGKTLNFGDSLHSYGSMHLAIFDGSKRLRKKLKTFTNPVNGLTIPSGATKQIVLPVSKIYNMQKDDDFSITAIIEHEKLSKKYQSNSVTISVRQGIIQWQQSFGVPEESGEKKIPVRTASFLLLHYKITDIYCLRIEDKKRVYAVRRLGPHVPGIPIAGEIDAMSNIHALIQMTPRLWSYRIYDSSGTLVQQRYYAYSEELDNPLPTLVRDPDVGRVAVFGGRRAAESVDYHLNK